MAKRKNPKPKINLKKVIHNKPVNISKAAQPSNNNIPSTKHNLKGLQNLGNTCYFNAMIQMILNCPMFMDDLKQFCSKNQTFSFQLHGNLVQLILKKEEVSCVEKELIGLWDSKAGSISPIELRRALLKSDIFRLHFGNNQQHDSHEVFLAVLNIVREAQIKRIRGALLDHFKCRSSADHLSDDDKKTLKLLGLCLEKFTPVYSYFGLGLSSVLTCSKCNGSRAKFEDNMHLAPVFTSPNGSSKKSANRGEYPTVVTASETLNEDSAHLPDKSLSKHQLKKQKRNERKAAKSQKRAKREATFDAADEKAKEDESPENNDVETEAEKTKEVSVNNQDLTEDKGDNELKVDVEDQENEEENVDVKEDFVYDKEAPLDVERHKTIEDLSIYVHEIKEDLEYEDAEDDLCNNEDDDKQKDSESDIICDHSKEEGFLKDIVFLDAVEDITESIVDDRGKEIVDKTEDKYVETTTHDTCVVENIEEQNQNILKHVDSAKISGGFEEVSGGSSVYDSVDADRGSSGCSLGCGVAVREGEVDLPSASMMSRFLADEDGGCVETPEQNLLADEELAVDLLMRDLQLEDEDQQHEHGGEGWRVTIDLEEVHGRLDEAQCSALVQSLQDRLFELGRGHTLFEDETDLDRALDRTMQAVCLDNIVCEAKCRCPRSHLKRDLLTRMPSALPLYVSRFRGVGGGRGVGTKDQALYSYPRLLNLSSLCSRLAVSTGTTELRPVVYRLYGIIEHQGARIDSGHFLCYVNNAVRQDSAAAETARMKFDYPANPLSGFRARYHDNEDDWLLGDDLDDGVASLTTSIGSQDDWYRVNDNRLEKISTEIAMKRQAFMLFYSRVQ